MINFADLKKLLSHKLAQAKYSISDVVQDQLTNYLLLLEKWNRTYNLTSVRDIEAMITQHILDSLSVTDFIDGKRVLDVGTGAGLPGIPLALIQPEREFVLLDSNGKKTRFLTHIVQTLNLQNVEIVQTRVEQFISKTCFDTIVTRAFSSIADFLEKTKHLCCTNGIFLAMKGSYPVEELAEINAEFNVCATHVLHVFGLDAQRHVVVIQQKTH